MNGKGVIFFTALICIGLLAAGCTTTTTIGNPTPGQGTPAASGTAASVPAAAGTTAPAQAATAAVVAVQTTPACPDREVLTGKWDTREVGYASNHDVRGEGVWADAGPVPVTLTQKCWDVTGTIMVGDCPGTLTGKIEKNVFSGKHSIECPNTAGSSWYGTFAVTMAPDNQSFMGSLYDGRPGSYGPEANFPPSWWAKKIS
jgi:hypothetical protein